ncbi:MAG: nitroreductase family protein [Actinomycetota bacterium]
MELTEVIKRRRMARNYLDKPVAMDTLERIVATGRRGPSAGFTQGVYFVVVTEADTRAAIAKLADEDHYVAEEGLPPWISSAPAHVVVCVSEADYHARYLEPDKINDDGSEIDWPIPYWWVDGGAALMLLLLAVVDEGLAAGFFGVHRLGGLQELLGIPEDVSPIGVVTIGHAAPDQPGSSARRGWRPLDDVVRWERW